MVFNAEFAGVYLLIRGLFNDVFIGPNQMTECLMNNDLENIGRRRS
jgi:hypothetical protein